MFFYFWTRAVFFKWALVVISHTIYVDNALLTVFRALFFSTNVYSSLGTNMHEFSGASTYCTA